MILAFIIAAYSTNAISSEPASPKPKYGPEATTLSLSHDFFKKNAGPDFWAVSPYYLPQQDDKSCSIASVAMVTNAIRVGQKLTADDELVTQKGLMKRVKDSLWEKYVGEKGHGVPLDDLAELVKASLQAYGVDAAQRVEVQTIHVDDLSPKTKASVHRALVENEKGSSDFIIANFLQGVYTGDAEVGHIAPVGAYDAKTKRVLVMDPDRQWYEPYWVSEETFLKGMNTVDQSSGKHRGFVWIKMNAHK